MVEFSVSHGVPVYSPAYPGTKLVIIYCALRYVKFKVKKKCRSN